MAPFAIVTGSQNDRCAQILKDVSLRGLNTEQFMAATHSRCRNLRTSAPTTLE
jgi:hypothetical protein